MIEVQSSTTLDALVRCRQVVMTRANDILTRTPASAPRADGDALHTMTALLMTSLEQLKVAEEELREQNAAVSEIRAAGDQRAHHYRQLFLHIPAPALVTDTQATIIEVNQAAEHLLRREAQYLEREPLAALLHPSSRPDFRTRVNRLVTCAESRQVCLTLNRHGDTPIDVDATVALVPDIDPGRSLALFWLFSARPATE